MAYAAQAEAETDVTFVKHLAPKYLPHGGNPPEYLEHKQFQVANDGIYRGVPVYDASHDGKTAIVAGANGISGAHMLRSMGRHPSIWSRVYALSRRPPVMKLLDDFAPNVSHHSIDLLTSPEQVGKELRDAGIKKWSVQRLLPCFDEHLALKYESSAAQNGADQLEQRLCAVLRLHPD